ncbi:hypothetical protein BpHYR1_031674 [Brachionus plicatilis]|uniref:Uncharacterized protein n=1 Tax=Brachionus plicatilis TaxID=10195 RepID=A0A3M7RIU7_BRAPC|nr:hypothetical protein BpHYR1_031674 [Brachionus plicatilis]
MDLDTDFPYLSLISSYYACGFRFRIYCSYFARHLSSIRVRRAPLLSLSLIAYLSKCLIH